MPCPPARTLASGLGGAHGIGADGHESAMTLTTIAARLRIDPYICAIVGMVGLASVWPATGQAAHGLSVVTTVAIAVLFFLYGARLAREAVIAGLTNWRLQLTVFLSTFVLFPLLALLFSLVLRPWLGEPLARGVLFLGLLPSTVQSSIAFTSIARGNVAAAICSASFSNLIGVVLTPLLVGLFLSTQGGFSLRAGCPWRTSCSPASRSASWCCR